jgi:quercetin dioxygenase-like cupin family protein
MMRGTIRGPLTLWQREKLLGATVLLAVAGLFSWHARAEGEHVRKVFEQLLPNLPGKTLTAVEVDYAPGAHSAPHRHAASAVVFAYVLSGVVRSQVEGGPVLVYCARESWFEPPGAHHVVSENASSTEPAGLLAVLVADTGVPLAVYDR